MVNCMLGLFLKEEVFFFTKSYLLDFSMLATHQESIWIVDTLLLNKKIKIGFSRYILIFM